MAFPAYTRQLVNLARAGPFQGTVYICPALTRTVVRDVTVQATVPDQLLSLQIKKPGGSVGTIWLWKVDTTFFNHLELRQAMHEDDELSLYIEGNTSVLMCVTGYELDA